MTARLEVALVVIGPGGVADHGDFAGRRRRLLDATSRDLRVRELDDCRGEQESTTLASAAMRWAGSARNVVLWSMRADWEWQAALGVRYLVENHSDVVRVIATNHAFGLDPKPPTGAPVADLEAAIELAYARRVTFLAAAGNGGPIRTPAVFEKAIAVGGWASHRCEAPRIRPDDFVHPLSSRGPEGSCKPNLLCNPGRREVADVGGGHVSVGGTSVAVGEAAGVVARLHALRPDLSCEEIRAELVASCRSVRAAGDDDRAAAPHEQGWGALDVEHALRG